jgi:hypothetical protein
MRDTRIALAPYIIAVFAAIAVLMGIFAVFTRAQAPLTYKPTEIQELRLQVRQRDAWLAQRDFRDAQIRYQQAVSQFQAEAEAIKKENGWPDGVKFNPDELSYAEAPAPASSPAKKEGTK